MDDFLGPATDISHCNTPAKVSGHAKDDLEGALQGCDVVVIPAGVPRKPGMTRDDLFNTKRDTLQSESDVNAGPHCLCV